MSFSHTLRRIKSKILSMLNLERRLRNWDDARYLRLLYRIRTGGRLDLEHPRGFNQKVQWLKIFDRRPIYTMMVDKYEAKEWAARRIGEGHIVPSLGVWDSFDTIDWDGLPEQFVLKCTHDSGGLVICDDRSALDFQAVRSKIEKSLARNYFYLGREWPYRDVKPRVLAEVYFPTWVPQQHDDRTHEQATEGMQKVNSPEVNGGVTDYKFYCFHGEPKFLSVSCGLHDHGSARRGFLTLDWEPLGFTSPDYLRFEEIPSEPVKLHDMIAIARKLCKGVPFVRVDLYEHLGTVLFSEMTFHPMSGMMTIRPKSADLEIGKLLDLSLVEVIR